MTTVTALPFRRPLTRADLEDTPDDGHRYELIDGVLILSPGPELPHQDMVGNLHLVSVGEVRRPDGVLVGAEGPDRHHYHLPPALSRCRHGVHQQYPSHGGSREPDTSRCAVLAA